jgi:magnesium transporter
MLTVLHYTDSTGWVPLEDVARSSDLVAASGNLLWARTDVSDLAPADVSVIAEEFGLHPLAVEDAISTRQRPKIEAYENHLFSVAHQLDAVDGQLEARQIASFVGARFVLTIHQAAVRTMTETEGRLRRVRKEHGRGPSYIMHTLLDTIVDDYQRIADDIEDEVEDLEEALLRNPDMRVEKQLYSLKQRLARFRRYAIPGGRVLSTVVEGSPSALVTKETGAYFRDVLDHTLRITDQIRNVDDLVGALLDLRRMDQANSLNEVTKRLTGWAAIIAVPTFIASVYGMNFELVPRSGRVHGFWFALGLMVATGATLYGFFKRRGWL